MSDLYIGDIIYDKYSNTYDSFVRYSFYDKNRLFCIFYDEFNHYLIYRDIDKSHYVP